MKKININTSVKKMLADVYTPVAIYLRVRDRFRDTILLESADHHAAENSYSLICINAIGGIEVSNYKSIETKLPNQKPEKTGLEQNQNLSKICNGFLEKFEVEENREYKTESAFAQGLYGYVTYDAISFFEKAIQQNNQDPNIPILRYRLYQYVLVFNHFKDELFFCENKIDGIESESEVVDAFIRSKDVPVFPFNKIDDEKTNLTGIEYKNLVQKGIEHCLRGDVFQIVLSKCFQQKFIGDEFNVYRALRSINPSPYLFYFDYGDYKLMGASPESQLLIKDSKAILHPIAGTVKRSGNAIEDAALAESLKNNPKENAEHVMLVDLARNDLSQICKNVEVVKNKETHYYSHVIHLVSEVAGDLPSNYNVFDVLANTFPAGTLSGAPKVKAMQLIQQYEPTKRSFYAGAIGYIGFNGSCTMAIIIRSMLSKNNTLTYQAGAGIVAASTPEGELEEVNNKLGAIKKAIDLACTIN